MTVKLISKSVPKDRLDQCKLTVSRDEKAGSSAKIRKEQMTSVIWETPIGLPIFQPYRKIKRKQVCRVVVTPVPGVYADSMGLVDHDCVAIGLSL